MGSFAAEIAGKKGGYDENGTGAFGSELSLGDPFVSSARRWGVREGVSALGSEVTRPPDHWLFAVRS
ncbi:hypothetical protein WN51_03314 [Melipona quadrifasciata]|uniref:Uncharacterized protein n=1 Tax=Melipona quadrifasciata TaxID=166423 RepID=A0A0M8ZVJ6_9HYME|nr:hypothetical protein WN51_03314 [Melipona quadrifasciata]